MASKEVFKHKIILYEVILYQLSSL